jgi:hypothetical protein
MPRTKRDDPKELLRLALIGFDAQIAELQMTHAQLAALINQPSASQDVEEATPQKRRKLSDAARAKISAAAKARWARERGAKAKVQKSKPAAKKAQSKSKSTKSRPATAKAKKASAKNGKGLVLSLPQPPGELPLASLKVSVKVINEKGQAIKMARVTLLPARGKLAAATGSSSAAGVFETKSPLKVGDYRLRVEHADYLKFEDQVEIIEGGLKGKAAFTVRLKSLLKK